MLDTLSSLGGSWADVSPSAPPLFALSCAVLVGASSGPPVSLQPFSTIVVALPRIHAFARIVVHFSLEVPNGIVVAVVVLSLVAAMPNALQSSTNKSALENQDRTGHNTER